MKKLFALVICAALFCACFGPASAESGSAASGIVCSSFACEGETYPAPYWEYELLPEGTARLLRCYDSVNPLIIPESVDGIPVSAVGAGALPDGSYISPVSIPDCVTVIDPDAFSNIHCTLRFFVSNTHPTLQVRDGILISVPEKRIIRGYASGDYAIPDGIETIDSYAFWGCAFSSVTIPESVTAVGRNPFAYCNATSDTSARLQSVSVSPDSTALCIRDGVLFSRADHRLVWCFDQFICREHPDYTVPDGTEIIDDFSFMRWGRLSSVTIPASVTQVGANPFLRVQSDDFIRLDSGNTALELADHLLLSRADRRVVACLVSFIKEPPVIPDGTAVIGDYAFYGAYGTDASTGNTVDVIIPDSVTDIGAWAFGYCNSLRPVLPAGIRTIGCSAFYNCFALAELPAFSGNVDIGSNAFGNCSGIPELDCPAGARIGEGAFGMCTGITEVRIGEGSSRIGNSSFYGCFSLRYAKFAEGLTAVCGLPFKNCSALEEISLPASLSFIGDGALCNDMKTEYNPTYDAYMPISSCTCRVKAPAGSLAEQYCPANGIDIVPAE